MKGENERGKAIGLLVSERSLELVGGKRTGFLSTSADALHQTSVGLATPQGVMKRDKE